MTESRLHMLAIGITVAVHAGILGGAWTMGHVDAERAKTNLADDQFVTIEAGLAVKKKSAAGKKSRLPQKDSAPKVKPATVPGIATDPDRPPDPNKPPEPRETVPPENIDPNATFDKFRRVATTGDESTPSGGGGDDENQESSETGSEWGTLADAKGDPYVGELVGRLTKDFDVPSLVGGDALEALGCVRLDADGKIIDRSVERKSRDATFNRAVGRRLEAKEADMETPVPEHLKKLLMVKGICVPYRL